MRLAWLAPGSWIAQIAGYELVGLSYIVAGTIAWLRRPDNRIGPAILVTGITSFIPVFVRIPIPAVTSVAFAFAWLTNLPAAFVLIAHATAQASIYMDPAIAADPILPPTSP